MIGERIALAIIIVMIYAIWLIKLPFYLLIRLFVCSWRGHDWRFYGGGFFNPFPDLPFIPMEGVFCRRCSKEDKK